MTDTICLDENYSTTRLLTKEKPELVRKPEDKFESVLFLPPKDDRKGEGGLRTKGYFKKSYEGKPLISVITVVYNGEKYLEETIKSVIEQTYDNVEYIIIDGGSTDGTVDIIRKYEDRIDYWVSERDEGIAYAFNKGIIATSGKYIQILNADDSLINNNIYMEIKDNIYGPIASFQALTDKNNLFPIYRKKVTEINKKNIKLAIKNSMISHQASFIQLDVYKNIGLYNSKYRLRMDFAFFMKAQTKYKFNCFNKPIVLYSTDGISSNIKNRLFFKIEEIKVINDFNYSLFYNIKFYIKLPFYIIKKILSYIYYGYL